MNADRATAYRRVLRTLEDLGPSKLHEAEQARIRDAADELLFSQDRDDASTLRALDDVEDLCGSLVQSGRWEQDTAHELANAVAGCGPAPALHAQAA